MPRVPLYAQLVERCHSRISGPLLVPIDMHATVPALSLQEPKAPPGEASAAVADLDGSERIRVWDLQKTHVVAARPIWSARVAHVVTTRPT